MYVPPDAPRQIQTLVHLARQASARCLHVQFAKKFRHRKRLMQATGKAIRLKLLRFHVATGSDRYYRNGLRLGEIRCTQQFQQVEATYRRHLYIGEQYVKSPGA